EEVRDGMDEKYSGDNGPDQNLPAIFLIVVVIGREAEIHQYDQEVIPPQAGLNSGSQMVVRQHDTCQFLWPKEYQEHKGGRSDSLCSLGPLWFNFYKAPLMPPSLRTLQK